ncbi:MAG TPA: hypothetical protein VNR38_08505 [Ureibacillus sp.]|nr:hypothetical protein [Ureibacillus sp.]
MTVFHFGDLMATLLTLIPLLLIVFVIRWIRIIRLNSEIQIQQNKEIISLLKEIAEK